MVQVDFFGYAVLIDDSIESVFTSLSGMYKVMHTEADREMLRNQITRECAKTEQAVFAIRLCLEEMLVNAQKHGNKGDTSKPVYVHYLPLEDTLRVTIRDQGEGFAITSNRDSTVEENRTIPNGRGLLLTLAHAQQLTYNTKGNCVQFTCARS